MMSEPNFQPTRRRILADAAAGSGLALVSSALVSSELLSVMIRPAAATPESMRAAIRNVIGEATVRKGRIKLDIPPLVESGNAVSLAISVESPMTANDHVKAIHVFNEKNPQPNVIGVKLGPRAGRASFGTRIRLADSQTVTAIAELSDGSFWSDSVQVIVTLPACLESL
jgi:sulfur-oxidizing protein SoxY